MQIVTGAAQILRPILLHCYVHLIQWQSYQRDYGVTNKRGRADQQSKIAQITVGELQTMCGSEDESTLRAKLSDPLLVPENTLILVLSRRIEDCGQVVAKSRESGDRMVQAMHNLLQF
jgi:hypothetical protein